MADAIKRYQANMSLNPAYEKHRAMIKWVESKRGGRSRSDTLITLLGLAMEAEESGQLAMSDADLDALATRIAAKLGSNKLIVAVDTALPGSTTVAQQIESPPTNTEPVTEAEFGALAIDDLLV